MWNRLMSLEVKEKAEAGLQCFTNHEHTVFKATELADRGYVGGESR